MNIKDFKVSFVLSYIIIVMMVILSIGGLLFSNLYKDNNHLLTVWHANDLVTLFIAVPIFIVSMVFFKNSGSIKALFIWFAMLWYSVYNYAYYLFGASFNAFFLLYVVIFSLSLVALIIGLSNFPIKIIKNNLQSKLPIKFITTYMLAVATVLTLAYTMQSIAFIITGEVPPIVIISGHVTSLVFAIDMSLVITFLIFGAILLLIRNPWGYVIAVLVNAKGALYMIVLTYASVKVASQEVFLWVIIGVLSFVVTVLLLKNLKPSKIQNN